MKYHGDKAKQLSIKLEKQLALKGNIVEAENMLIGREITAEAFNNIVTGLNFDLMSVNNDVEILSTNTDSIAEYVETGL